MMPRSRKTQSAYTDCGRASQKNRNTFSIVCFRASRASLLQALEEKLMGSLSSAVELVVVGARPPTPGVWKLSIL